MGARLKVKRNQPSDPRERFGGRSARSRLALRTLAVLWTALVLRLGETPRSRLHKASPELVPFGGLLVWMVVNSCGVQSGDITVESE
jgi:hypothetical protein